MKVPTCLAAGSSKTSSSSLQIQRNGKRKAKNKENIRIKVDSSVKCAFQFESGKTMRIFTLWTLLRFRNYLRCLELHFRPAKDPFALFFSLFQLVFSWFFRLQRPLAINHGAEKGKFYMKTRLGLSSTRLCGMWQVASGKLENGKRSNKFVFIFVCK